MPPLSPDSPPAEASTTLPKIEHYTTTHINTEEVVSEDTTYDDDTEDILPIEIIHNEKYEDKEDK